MMSRIECARVSDDLMMLSMKVDDYDDSVKIDVSARRRRRRRRIPLGSVGTESLAPADIHIYLATPPYIFQGWSGHIGKEE